MRFKNASIEDFDAAYDYIEKLWTYNDYDRDEIFKVYRNVTEDSRSFAFFLQDDDGGFHGFCHGTYFDTFWLSGKTCYVSSLITNESERGRGYGIMLMDHARELALRENCKGMVLDSGFPREEAHKFYERYGFDKSCYGFDLLL